MTLQELAIFRLHNQHLVTADFETAEEVVRYFGAVQAQDLLSALNNIRQRIAGRPTELEVEQADYDTKIVRTWPMRGTLHYVPAEDAAWMVQLLAGRTNQRMASLLAKEGLTPQLLQQAEGATRELLAAKQYVLRKELYEVFADVGMKVGNGSLQAMLALSYLAQAGVICLGPRDGKQQTVVLLEDISPKARKLSGDEAWAEIAHRYFRSHGPATAQDFAFWTGHPLTTARRAVDLIKTELDTVECEGVDYWFVPPAAQHRLEAPVALLLSPFDELTVGYTDRRATVDPAHMRPREYGVGANMIWNGMLVGTWRRTLKQTTVKVELQPFHKLTTDQHEAFLHKAQEYADSLGQELKVEVLHG